MSLIAKDFQNISLSVKTASTKKEKNMLNKANKVSKLSI